MPAVGAFLAELGEAYRSDLGSDQIDYRRLLEDGLDSPYRMTDGRRSDARALLDDVATLGVRLGDAEDALASGRPSPPPRARMVPPE